MNIKARSIALCFCFVVVDFLNAADFTANNLTVSQDATIAGASGFGTVYTGVGTAATSSLGYRFSVTQSTEEVPVEVTQSSWVEGYYQDQTVTVEDYGTISAGYWESMYTYQVVGYEWLPPVYDEFGFPIEGGYFQDIWGYVWTGEYWVDQSYWGVINSHTEIQQIWVDGYTNTWTTTEYQSQYGSPRLEFTATRSDANWVWRVPSASGAPQDVLVVWNGGLRIPSQNPGRLMALTSDNFTQSVTVTNSNGSPSTLTTKVAAEEIKANKLTANGDGTEEENTTQMQPKYLRMSKEVRQGGASTTVHTQIGANYAHFGGVMKVEGNMTVRGVLRVLPAGDLDMGSFTNGAQP